MMDTGAVGSAHSIVRQVQLYVDYKHKWKTHKAALAMIQLLTMLNYTVAKSLSLAGK